MQEFEDGIYVPFQAQYAVDTFVKVCSQHDIKDWKDIFDKSGSNEIREKVCYDFCYN